MQLIDFIRLKGASGIAGQEAERHQLLKAGCLDQEGYMASHESGILQQKGQAV